MRPWIGRRLCGLFGFAFLLEPLALGFRLLLTLGQLLLEFLKLSIDFGVLALDLGVDLCDVLQVRGHDAVPLGATFLVHESTARSAQSRPVRKSSA